ncbi:MAG: nitroreductase family protein [Candidatus Nanoarchaeia archaeon]|nr:nitroreductase family protein [Candidatus Nanoarchaeia archaeon]
MDLKKAITERRSIRSFKLKDIKLKEIYECLDIARFAPSSGNLQNWRVMIVNDKEIIKRLAVACVRQRWIADASVVLIILSEPDNVKKVYGTAGELYAIENISFFTQNLILLLHEKGLGSCIIGSFDKVTVKKLIKCPDYVEPLFVLPVGISNEIEKKPVRAEVEDFTYHYAERWGLARKWRDRDPTIDTDITRIKESLDKKRKRFFEKVSEFFKNKK